MPDPRHLRALLRSPDLQPDADLLARFVADRDADAFTILVRRHGPMVLSVCRRVLGCAHDADDAFQATFLVLARRAGAVRPRSLLANWLYGVAYRTALEARRAVAVRRAKEQRAAGMRDTAVVPTEPESDLRELLDRELAALPDVYRVAVVVCDLEGLGRKDAAVRLGWTEGTLSGRLARARALLAKRLARHGLAICAGALGAAAGPGAVACLPAGLAESTARVGVLVAAGEAAVVVAPVAALTEGVMKAMLLTKLKGMATVLVVSCAVMVTAAAGWRAEAGGPQDRPVPSKAAKKVRDADKDRIAELERERDRLLKLVAELQDRLTALEADRRKEKERAAKVTPRDPAAPGSESHFIPAPTPSVVTPSSVTPSVGAPPPAAIPITPPLNVPTISETPPPPAGSPPRDPSPGSLPPPSPGNPLPPTPLPEPTAPRVDLPPNTLTPNPPADRAPQDPGLRSLTPPAAENPPPGPALADPTPLPRSSNTPAPLGGPPRPTIATPLPPKAELPTLGEPAPKAASVGMTKVYAVEDLAADEKQATALIKVVQRAVEPSTWDTQGGSGVIEYFAVGKALIVRNTTDAHKQLDELLTMLREVAKKKATSADAPGGTR